MRKTGIDSELRSESIECRPCSHYFVDKQLREVLDFFVAHLFRLSFPFAMRSGFPFLKF